MPNAENFCILAPDTTDRLRCVVANCYNARTKYKDGPRNLYTSFHLALERSGKKLFVL